MNTLDTIADWELVRADLPRGRFRAAVFDFDGTVSLLREGWPRIMGAQMRDALRATGTTEPDEIIDSLIESIVVGLNGKPTVVQMAALANEVTKRGGNPLPPSEYAAQYQSQLLAMIEDRYRELRSGDATPDCWAVGGTLSLLDRLRERKVPLYLLSGTEVTHVRREVSLLALTPYFEGRLFAPVGDDAQFTKRRVIESIVSELELRPGELLGFGDGVVETAEVRRVGGVAIAVASSEPPATGVNAWKRDHLVRAGADAVVGDYRGANRWLPWLFAEV